MIGVSRQVIMIFTPSKILHQNLIFSSKIKTNKVYHLLHLVSYPLYMIKKIRLSFYKRFMTTNTILINEKPIQYIRE